ncbi:uncharacterized protein LOC119687734 isoform X2 [Teleopsis dalmanni]|uniref:uncharacterized protein LOC119668741 isoform X2 n=1 Tax=Teleopsis dalmanni TaxID=139649 RepID=UPI0018CD35BF|nr:uncharacterized protein LOC119668741 isoform X2 [Teleopsis dalmanni]XP_037958215.1 uncharacterized protein LOC119687734 isoform X2 [Teleopsis dalmanni]
MRIVWLMAVLMMIPKVLISSPIDINLPQYLADSDYIYMDPDFNDLTELNEELNQKPKKNYEFGAIPRAALIPDSESSANDATTECEPEKPEDSSTTECVPDTEKPGSQTSETEKSGATTTECVPDTEKTEKPAPAEQTTTTTTTTECIPETPASQTSTTECIPESENPPAKTGHPLEESSSGSQATSTAGGSQAAITAVQGAEATTTSSMSKADAAGNAEHDLKTKELHTLIQQLYVAQARVQLEATEIKKSQAIANSAQQDLEEAANRVRTVTAMLQNAQQEVAACAIRAQTAQLQLAAHDQLLFAARQDVDALSSQMVGLQAAEGISPPKISFDVSSLMEKLKQPLAEAEKPTPVPTIINLPVPAKPRPVNDERVDEEYYYD